MVPPRRASVRQSASRVTRDVSIDLETEQKLSHRLGNFHVRALCYIFSNGRDLNSK